MDHAKKRNRIAVVVPTIRPESLDAFLCEWDEFFSYHRVLLIVVHDGANPFVTITDNWGGDEVKLPWTTPPAEFTACYRNFSPAIRNVGFAAIAKHLPEVSTIITLDDDVRPEGDTIGHHLSALREINPAWFSTASRRMRGGMVRQGSFPTMVSHGVWSGVPDFDAATQLAGDCSDVSFPADQVPFGQFFPMCGMNLAFRREALPWMYFAPVADLPGCERFDDIWCGLYAKRELDRRHWGVMTGLARVVHERASNVFRNLIHEAVGIAVNEHLWQHLDDPEWFMGCEDLPEGLRAGVVEWLKEYAVLRETWAAGILGLESEIRRAS